MQNGYITIVGAERYFGMGIFKVGQELLLRKDYDNRFDGEAVEAVLEGVDGIVGYVANSCHTVARGTQSAGRIYDKFRDSCRCRVSFIVNGSVIAGLISE
ncbi:MAG: hypothetical protein JXB33_02890 [Clostridia bacterium]|nr:hypothetical protein [Clostridia bacterium]